MNERLEKEIEQYTKESLAIKFPVLDMELIASDIKHTAQYFYDLALENVRKEVERKIDDYVENNGGVGAYTHTLYEIITFLGQLSE